MPGMINAYLVETIQILRRPNPPFDSWGEPLPQAALTVKAYTDWRNRLVRDKKGEQVLSRALVYLHYDGLLTNEDRLLIAGVEYPIIQIGEIQDFSRDHYEVYIA